MLLNSDLTSNELPARPEGELLIAFGNLLDDRYVGKGVLPQKERIPGLAHEFTHINGGQTPDLAGWCEGASPDELYELAEETGLWLPHGPCQYSPSEWMAVAVDRKLNIEKTPEFIPYGKPSKGFRSGLFAMKAAGVEFRILHQPDKILRDLRTRYTGTDLLAEGLDPNVPTVIAADFNELSFQHTRSVLLKLGFIEVHAANRPVYPNPGFRGKTYPRLLWSMSLDGIFVSNHFEIIDFGAPKNTVSDHPFPYVRLRPLQPSTINHQPVAASSSRTGLPGGASSAELS